MQADSPCAHLEIVNRYTLMAGLTIAARDFGEADAWLAKVANECRVYLPNWGYIKPKSAAWPSA